MDRNQDAGAKTYVFTHHQSITVWESLCEMQNIGFFNLRGGKLHY